MTNSDRSCIGCKWWSFDAGWPGTSITPGDAWTAECFKQHWHMQGRNVDAQVWFTTMQKAQTCQDYDPRRGAPR